MSAVIAPIVAGFKKCCPQTNWLNYRANEEPLKKGCLHGFRIDPYQELDDEAAAALLVKRTESIISSDIARFAHSLKHRGKEKATNIITLKIVLHLQQKEMERKYQLFRSDFF